MSSRGSRDDDKPPGGVPSTSRTMTLDDPLTTQILAEVAKRNVTIELSPQQLEEAMARAEAAAPANDDAPGETDDAGADDEPGAADPAKPVRGGR